MTNAELSFVDAAPRAQTQQKERRALTRIRDRFAVTLSPIQGKLKKPLLKGMARDFDAAGLCIISPSPFPVGKAAKLKFHIPRSMSGSFKGLFCRVPVRVRDVRVLDPRKGSGYEIVLELDRPLPEIIEGVIARHQKRVKSVIWMTVIVILWLTWNNLRFFWYTPLLYLYSLSIGFYFLSRFILAWLHRSPPLGNYIPSLSIVISVRNEVEMIARTVEGCFAADYPDDKREVIVINDGSTDGTESVLRGIEKKFRNLTVRTIPPSGKRHGMSEGVRLAKGEIIVFVDSDTFLHPMALRHIVCGFEDPTLGAVSGHTDVENANKNILTGLQEVRYYVSFRLLKSSESLFGCVTCCPGCLSAYRKAYLLEILDQWLHQRFLGAPATFGDDRSLTNFILRKYRVTYNELATATTMVPETWPHYMRQQVRWKKSWLRETLIASSFLYKKHPLAAISFYVSSICSVLSPWMAYRAIYWEIRQPSVIFLYYLLGLMLFGLCQSLYYLYKRTTAQWLLGMIMVAAQVILMGPQTYYAMLTMRKNHWGTR